MTDSSLQSYLTPAHAMKAYQTIASALATLATLANDSLAPEVRERAEERLENALSEFPSGSGFDHGTKLLDASTPDRLVFQADFHHMDDLGGYCGWSEHKVIVTPSLAHEFNLRVTGRDKRGIKEYIAETFAYCLGK